MKIQRMYATQQEGTVTYKHAHDHDKLRARHSYSLSLWAPFIKAKDAVEHQNTDDDACE